MFKARLDGALNVLAETFVEHIVESDSGQFGILLENFDMTGVFPGQGQQSRSLSWVRAEGQRSARRAWPVPRRDCSRSAVGPLRSMLLGRLGLHPWRETTARHLGATHPSPRIGQ